VTDAAGKPLALRSTPRREIICSKIEQQISAAMLQGRTYLAGLAQKMRKEGAKEQCGGPCRTAEPFSRVDGRGGDPCDFRVQKVPPQDRIPRIRTGDARAPGMEHLPNIG